MFQFIAPNCLHGSRPVPVAVGDVRPSLAAALVLFQPLVARRVQKTAAPDLVPTVTVRMMNGLPDPVALPLLPLLPETAQRYRIGAAFSLAAPLLSADELYEFTPSASDIYLVIFDREQRKDAVRQPSNI